MHAPKSFTKCYAATPRVRAHVGVQDVGMCCGAAVGASVDVQGDCMLRLLATCVCKTTQCWTRAPCMPFSGYLQQCVRHFMCEQQGN